MYFCYYAELILQNSGRGEEESDEGYQGGETHLELLCRRIR